MKTIFDSTKLKLTGLYLVIIMFITLSFSFFIFSEVNKATERALDGQRRRMEKQFFVFDQNTGQKQVMFQPFKDEAILEIRERVFYNLIVINVVIFVVSGSLGYILAEKTLKPIEEMITKQKRFISDAAHELKTPLTAIKTDLEVTLRDKNLNLADSKETLKRTIEEVDELALLTNHLLASSKYNNGDIYQKDIKTFKLEDLINKVVKKLSSKAKDKNIKIEKELTKFELTADQLEIEHVLINLIDNAIKYSNNNSEVKISLQEVNKKAVIVIQDNGIGISDKNINQIFEPFYRADKSRNKSTTEGYGLGLAITKDIIESYGGTISVVSQPDNGSTFTITIPLHP